MNSIVTDRINSLIDTLLPNGAGPMTDDRLRFALEQVAQVAFTQGKSHALMGLLSVDQVAERLGVSRRRANAIIQARHERFGTGARVGNTWFVHEDELGSLRPGPQGWPKGRPRKPAE